ncbi:hypothetical protein B296_00058802 [Ensete ventricosum]|uniref:Uncharacterized protein n=1 Tax=Ensete ventricosum TaxID=4639 RepID=A0A426X5N3_ENSVE|nr:hypothetical protein B296_00058802 [Ensete ventricosum]
MKVVMMNESGEAEGEGERKPDHHILSTMGKGIGENEVEGGRDENTQEEKRLGDHHVPSIGLDDAHPLEERLEVPELITSVREVCIQRFARQQRLNAATGGRFHNDTTSRH